jgi:hypothetical protein
VQQVREVVSVIDWHTALPGEPPCGPRSWRQKNRRSVIKIKRMEDRQLGHCIQFAQTKPRHATKLQALLDELLRRMMNDAWAGSVDEDLRQLAQTHQLKGSKPWPSITTDTSLG